MIRVYGEEVRTSTNRFAQLYTPGLLPSSRHEGPLPWWLSTHRAEFDDLGELVRTTHPQLRSFCADWTLIFVVCWLFVLAKPVAAQQPVAKVPDALSYATAAANPTIAFVKALQGPSKGCHLARLAASEAIGNVVTFSLKHTIASERPCLGCAPDGMPSGHTMNSFIGSGWSWGAGISLGVGTGALRMAAHRHTFAQVTVGAAIGLGAEWIGQRIPCREN